MHILIQQGSLVYVSLRARDRDFGSIHINEFPFRQIGAGLQIYCMFHVIVSIMETVKVRAVYVSKECIC